MTRFGALALAGVLVAAPPAAGQHGHDNKIKPPATATACESLDLKCARTATPAFGPDGSLWLVWDAGGKVLVSRSKDLGGSFDPPVVVYSQGAVSLDSGPDARPKIVVGKDGRLILAFATRDDKYNGQVLISGSTDGGRTFSTPRAIAPTSPSQRFETLALDPSGRLFTAWIDKRGSAAAKANGEKYAGAALAFAWDAESGAARSAIARDHTCECCRIGVGFTGPGKPVVLFRNIFEGGVRDHAVITFSGPDTPGPVHRVSIDDAITDSCPHHGPSLAIAPNGDYHVVWMAVGRKLKGAYYASSRDQGATFSEPMPLGAKGAQASRPFVLASKSAVHVVWKELADTKARVMLISSLDDGRSWTAPRALGETEDSSDHPLLIEQGGDAYLSWLTQREGYRLIAIEATQ